MSLGDKPTEGNKKSNYSYQSKNVGILARISASVALGATEATLISVLNAIVASDQDLEILLVRDAAVGNGDPVLRQITNWETGVPVITYENVDGTTYVPSPNPVPVYVYLDPSAVLQLILSEMLDQGLTLDDIELNTDDNATETTLAAALVILQNTTTGLNQEITQLLVKGVLDAIKLDTANLDVALSTRATEATQLLVKAVLDTIKLDTANLDVALSTRASEATVATIDSNVVLGNLTLNSINTKLTPAPRTHNTVSASVAGSVPAGSMSGSVLNAGSAAGTWNGISIPAGVSIPWGPIGNRDTYGAIAYDGSGTTLIIEYTT